MTLDCRATDARENPTPSLPGQPIVSRKPRRRRRTKTADGSGPLRPKADEILMVPLGGCSQIGMNMTLYGHDGKWIIVDAGVAFLDEEECDGLRAIMPDPAFVEERMKDVLALVLTHAHEDHLGAVHHLWPRLKCPIYATPFAAAALRDRFLEKGTASQVRVRTYRVGEDFRIGPFSIESAAVTHSIPEPVALAIRTRAGTVIHTGDWKLDPVPLVGRVTDEAKLTRLGDEGVLALVCDSTNAHVPGRTASEDVARIGLEIAFQDRPGMIAVACFASNIARIKAIAMAARKVGRRCALVGRSLLRMEKNARQLGLLDGVPEFLTDQEAARVPRRELVLVCTGTQGEERSALARIAYGEHRFLRLRPDDTVIFSARRIPGNEEAIDAMQERLRDQRCTVLTPADGPVHVSGHPAQGDLRAMYGMVRPQVLVPVHGTPKHLADHADFARSCGVPDTFIPRDGAIIRLRRSGCEIVGEARLSFLADDGRKLVPLARMPGADAHVDAADEGMALAH